MSVANIATAHNKKSLARRSAVVALTAGLLVAGAAGTASAKKRSEAGLEPESQPRHATRSPA